MKLKALGPGCDSPSLHLNVAVIDIHVLNKRLGGDRTSGEQNVVLKFSWALYYINFKTSLMMRGYGK